ncbi:MAG: hypothetical protein ACM31E_00100 [Fibrobacterota bacterium]|nr:hypothetical protein [Chitinispirillaceae bacterium]
MIKTISICLGFIITFYVLILMSTSGAGVALRSSRLFVQKPNLHAAQSSSSYHYGK